MKNFSHAIVDHLALIIPQRLVAKSGPANRVDKIFLNYLRTASAQPRCTRGRHMRDPDWGVSVLIESAELGSIRADDHWQLANIGPRFTVGNSPQESYAMSAQDLRRAMKNLALTQRLRTSDNLRSYV